jgi:uncharacterized integral membrane protein (TIGR00697 family)
MNELIFLFHTFSVIGLSIYLSSRGIHFLMGWIGLLAVMANLFVIKQTELFGLTVTCSDVYAVGGMVALNLLQEFHGRSWGKSAIDLSFTFLLAFGLMSQFHLFYYPSIFDQTHQSFNLILSSTPRLFAASITSFWVVQRIDLALFQIFKQRYPDLSLSIRSGISISISQIVDTVLFTFLGLYGLAADLGSIILVALAIKLLVIITASPILTLAKRIHHDRDGATV